jgi:hypothetical protein
MKDRRGAYRVLVGRPDTKSPLVRPRYRWDDNINMYILGVGGTGRRQGLIWLKIGIIFSQISPCLLAGDCECGNEMQGIS